MRPTLRILKHVSLALFLIAAGICMLEVGLRAHHLKTILGGQRDGLDAQLSRPCPLTYQHLPFSFRTLIRSEETGREIEIATNSLGLRGPEVSVPKPPGMYRIVCLGDDATLAAAIAEEETFCRLLHGILQPAYDSQVDVINAGQPGHCPLLSLAWARTRLLSLQPDLVILCCDVSDVGDDRRCRPLAEFDNAGHLLSVGHPAAQDRPTDWFSAVEDEFLIARLLGKHLGDRMIEQLAPDNHSHSDSIDREYGLMNTAHPAALVEQAWAPIGDLQTLCRQISTDFVVTVVPSAATVRSVEAMELNGVPDRTGEMLARLAEVANREQIPMLDASIEFARQEARSQLFLDASGALATDGHRLFAEILGQALLARRNGTSAPETVPVGGAVPVDAEPPPASPPTVPLPNLRRPRAAK